MTRPRQTSPLGRYSSCSEVDSSLAGATRRSARRRSFCGRPACPTNETICFSWVPLRITLPVRVSLTFAEFQPGGEWRSGPTMSSGSATTVTAPAVATRGLRLPKRHSSSMNTVATEIP